MKLEDYDELEVHEWPCCGPLQVPLVHCCMCLLILTDFTRPSVAAASKSIDTRILYFLITIAQDYCRMGFASVAACFHYILIRI